MDKAEQIGNAIYTSIMKRLLKQLVRSLNSNIITENPAYLLRKNIFNNLDNQEKEYFIEYLESILDDCTSTVLAGLEGETDIDLYPCESIEMSCDGVPIYPCITDEFKNLVDKNHHEKLIQT